MAHSPSSAGPCGPFCTCCPVRHAAGLPLNSNVRPHRKPLRMSDTAFPALERTVRATRVFAIAVALCAVTFFFTWFYVFEGRPLSTDPAAWGQFGDYIGGLLNPLFALLAFYWLTRSVLIQKEELLESRKALRDAATSQASAATSAELANRVDALTALLNSASLEVQSLRNSAQSLVARADAHSVGSARLESGKWATAHEVIQELEHLDLKIATAYTRKLKVEHDLRTIVPSSNAA
jgi:hypothetical protein